MSNFDYEKDIVESYKRKGFDVSFQDVNEVREICKVKLKAAKFEDKRFYMPILFADEMKNYIYRNERCECCYYRCKQSRRAKSPG